MQIDSVLKDLGLSPKEIAVFTALLDIGPSSVRDLVSRSNVNRGTIYDILESLEQQGLVVKAEYGTRLKFSSVSPAQLLQVLENRTGKLLRLKEEVERNLPELMARFGEGSGKPRVSVWEGKNGVAAILADVLESVNRQQAKEYYVFSASGLRQDVYKAMPDFSKERIRRNIKVKTIALGEGGRVVGMDERKWLTKSAGVGATYELIYAGKVAHISLNESGNTIGVIIENNRIYETQKIVFESLWDKLEN